MVAEKMKPYLKNNSAIRMMFEEGNRLKALYGPENVFDFSLGNLRFRRRTVCVRRSSTW